MANKNPKLRRISGLENLLSVSESVGVVGEGEDLAFVSKAVEKHGGKDGIAKEVSPAIEALVGGNDNGGILVELGDELEEDVGFFLIRRYLLLLPVSIKRLCLFQRKQDGVFHLHSIYTIGIVFPPPQ